MDRQVFLRRVERAVHSTGAPSDAARPATLAGTWDGPTERDEMVALFIARLAELGGTATVSPDRREALAAVSEALAAAGLRSVACPAGLEWEGIAGIRADDARGADFGLSEAAWGIADTGTVVLRHQGEHGRTYSLVPPAVGFLLPVSRLLPRLGAVLRAVATDPAGPPACITFVSGVSHSGDIAGVTCTGVHGPGQVHVWIIGDE
jgi:L-lactate utilization protein LutC